jgi:secondary thiamine-phosphate synthase enzyme
MRVERFEVDTTGRRVVDITERVFLFVRQVTEEGLLSLFVPHATAGLALIETGSGSEGDLVDAIERLLPRDADYRHRHGSEGHGADHLLPAFVASFLVLPVVDGRAILGTWQRVVIVDTNRENNSRTVVLSFLAG